MTKLVLPWSHIRRSKGRSIARSFVRSKRSWTLRGCFLPFGWIENRGINLHSYQSKYSDFQCRLRCHLQDGQGERVWCTTGESVLEETEERLADLFLLVTSP